MARVRHCFIGSGRLADRSLRTRRDALDCVRHVHVNGRSDDRGRSLGRYASRVLSPQKNRDLPHVCDMSEISCMMLKMVL